jgi:hypothetical protein
MHFHMNIVFTLDLRHYGVHMRAKQLFVLCVSDTYYRNQVE